MLSALIGLIVSVLALWGMFVWWNDFLIVLRGLVPVSFVFGGIVAIVAGIAGWHEKRKK